MSNQKIKPPKHTKSDDIYVLFFVVISMIPWAGSILAEALKRRWPSKFEKAEARWRMDITAQGNRTAQEFQKHRSIEEGVNANGSWRRTGDGMQEIEATVEIAHEYGDSISTTFPAAFAKPPIIQTFDESHPMKVAKVTSYGASYRLVDCAYRETITFRYRGIGR